MEPEPPVRLAVELTGQLAHLQPRIAMASADTRTRILEVAEHLFGQHGFNGTSVDRIAREAGVNKALIYYYFDDKASLITALFDKVMGELGTHLRDAAPPSGEAPDSTVMAAKVAEEVTFLERHRHILAVLLMEALKADNRDDAYLFRWAESVVEHELGARGGRTLDELQEKQRYLVHEFFTGFLPLVAFVALRDRWSAHYGCDPDALRADFVAAFERTHLRDHPEPV